MARTQPRGLDLNNVFSDLECGSRPFRRSCFFTSSSSLGGGGGGGGGGGSYIQPCSLASEVTRC